MLPHTNCSRWGLWSTVNINTLNKETSWFKFLPQWTLWLFRFFLWFISLFLRCQDLNSLFQCLCRRREKLTASVMNDLRSTISPIISILTSPPLSIPLLWLPSFPTYITEPPLGRPGQGAGQGESGPVTKHHSLRHLNTRLPSWVSCPSGRVLSAEPGLLNRVLIRKQNSELC